MNQIDLEQNDSPQTKSGLFKEHLVVKKYFFYAINTLLFIFIAYAIIISIVYVNYSKITDQSDYPTTSILTTTTTTEDPFGQGPWQNPTLSSAVIPSDYQLTLRVYPKLETYEGTLRIRATNMKEGNDILMLHVAEEIRIEDPMVTIVSNNEQIPIVSSFPYKKNEYFVMKLSRGIRARVEIFIDIQFERLFDSDEQKGFYMKKFKDSDGKIKNFMGTNFKNSNARRTFPCFDEPKFTTSLNLVIKHPLDTYAISGSKRIFEKEITVSIGDKDYESTFDRIENVSTDKMNWFIMPRDFSMNTVLGYTSQ